jgi:kynurenine formamidase
MSATDPDATPTREDLNQMYDALRNWGRWGHDDERGALNHLSDEIRARAYRVPQQGRVLSMAHDLVLAPSPEQPEPAHHHMLNAGDTRDANGIPGYEASRDYFATAVHGMGVTHIDALCHMFVRGEMYNGVPAEAVRSDGATRNTLLTLADGLFGRGVLLDIPNLRGVGFIEPPDLIRVSDLEAAEKAQRSPVGRGDILVVSTGRDARRDAMKGDLNPGRDGLAGVHAECLAWFQDREIAALGSDAISDPTPGLGIDHWPFPIHQIGITGMGLHLIDNMNLGPVSAACRELRRFEFLLSAAPIRIPRATGCPINPIAAL